MSMKPLNALKAGLFFAGHATCALAAAAPCGAPSTFIADVRAASATSPLAGKLVEIEAVVTADYSGPDGFMGFFVQQADAQRQHRAGVSEGLFVYAPRYAARAGDQLRLAGTVEERYGQTQLALSGLPSVCASGRSVTPATLALPFSNDMSPRALEGMLVTVPQTLTVNDTHDLGRYGSLLLGHGRLHIPTAIAAPREGAAQLAADNALNRLVLDDGSSQQNPAIVPYPAPALSTANPVRAGDTVTALRGVLEKRYGNWRLQPVPGAAPIRFTAANPRQPAPIRAAGTDARVAAFNVLNYFNGNGQGGGFDAPDNRGARNAADFARQEAKLLAALRALDADVIGLMEVENNGFGPRSAVQRLASQLGPDWRAVEPGTPRLGLDAISVALLYNQRTVMPLGTPATTVLEARSRQPLAQTFAPVGNPSQSGASASGMSMPTNPLPLPMRRRIAALPSSSATTRRMPGVLRITTPCWWTCPGARPRRTPHPPRAQAATPWPSPKAAAAVSAPSRCWPSCSPPVRRSSYRRCAAGRCESRSPSKYQEKTPIQLPKNIIQ